MILSKYLSYNSANFRFCSGVSTIIRIITRVPHFVSSLITITNHFYKLLHFWNKKDSTCQCYLFRNNLIHLSRSYKFRFQNQRADLRSSLQILCEYSADAPHKKLLSARSHQTLSACFSSGSIPAAFAQLVFSGLPRCLLSTDWSG